MTASNQAAAVPRPLSVSKEKKTKNFYEHGKDALGLALSVAEMQEEKTLRKTAKHHQSQVGKSHTEWNDRKHANGKRKRLEEAKVMISSQRAETKKEKAKLRKKNKHRLRQRDNVNIIAPNNSDTTTAAPRKRVSFA